ncbi:MAG TPA: DUF4345 family protein [Aequorivita sp.]|nr:DUF4345 family protein [Aequorivita sp.]
MEIALRVLLGIVALICFLGGINLLLKGAMKFLPKEMPPQLVLDNLVRFLAGIYFASGFLFSYAALYTSALGTMIYIFGITVIFSGLGRVYSRYKVGSAGKYFDFIMLFEVVLGLSIIALKYFA